MNKLFAFLAILYLASCQEASEKRPETVSETEALAEREQQQEVFYKRLEGTIAGQPVVMNIVKDHHHISGTYYYRKTGGFISIEGYPEGDGILFSEMADDDGASSSAKIRIAFKGDVATGTWISADEKKTYPVHLEEKYPEGSYAFEYAFTQDSLKPYPDMKDGPTCDIMIGYLVPKSKNELISQSISRMIDDSKGAGTITPGEAAIKACRDYIKDYRDVIKENADNGIDRDAPSNSWEYMMDMTIPYNENGYLVLESNYYDYSGGAHPNHGSKYVALDMKNSMKMQLSDVIDVDSATIAPIMEEYFRKGNENIEAGQPLSEVLFENYLLPNENFYFNEKGIGFWYNPYEIAAYVYGDTEIFIPFERLKVYLTPEFRLRMRL